MLTPLLRRPFKQSVPSPDHISGLTTQALGFSLIECLVAIVMVALVSGAIAPALVVSVATRVHSQKTEQALALAQSEIDKVRVLVERGGYTLNDLPPLEATLDDKDVRKALGPDLSVAAVPPNFAHAAAVDVDGDDKPDFLVQRYRAKGQVVNNLPVAFAMGVRVYDINFAGTGNLPTKQASLVMTSGDGGRSTSPLAALYTTMAISNSGDSLCSLTTYFNSTVETSKRKALPAICVPPAPAPGT